jgi:hypothetical protein
MARAPARVIKIEITKANLGRKIKNLEIIL